MDAVWGEIVTALAAKVPEMVVFLLLVGVFMRAQKNMVKEFTNYMASKDEQFEGVIEQNTQALRENTKALGVAMHFLEEQDG